MRVSRWIPWFLNPYSRWSVGREARRQALVNLPPWESSEQPHFVRELKDVADGQIIGLGEKWVRVDRTLRQRWSLAARDVLLFRREEEEAEARYGRACDIYREVHQKDPPPVKSLRNIAYWILVAVLLIVEFPMNEVVFRLFGENEIFTAITTCAIALSLLVCAHDFGRRLKQWEFESRVDKALTVTALILPVLTVACVAYLRQIYLKQSTEEVSTIPSAALYGVFSIFNLIIFGAAVLAAYHSTPHKALADVVRTWRELSHARRALSRAEKAEAKARKARENAHQEMFEQAMGVRDLFQSLVRHYRSENLYYRKDRVEQSDHHPVSSVKRLREVLEVTAPATLASRSTGFSDDPQKPAFTRATLDWGIEELPESIRRQRRDAKFVSAEAKTRDTANEIPAGA